MPHQSVVYSRRASQEYESSNRSLGRQESYWKRCFIKLAGKLRIWILLSLDVRDNILVVFEGKEVYAEEMRFVGEVLDDTKATHNVFYEAGEQVRQRPQMLIAIISKKSAKVYNQFKGNCDCRFGKT